MAEPERPQDDSSKKLFIRTATMKQLTQPRELKSALLKVFSSEIIRKKCRLTIIPDDSFIDSLVAKIESNLAGRSNVQQEADRLLKKDENRTLGSAFQDQIFVLASAIREVLAENFRISLEDLNEKLVLSLLGFEPGAAEKTGEPAAIGAAKVLIVDDTRHTRRILQHLLLVEGVLTAEAADGEEALHYLAKQKPQLILLDIHIPKINGRDLLHLMKNNPNLKDVPVIMISSAGTPDVIRDCIKLGAADFIVKPFKSAVVIEKVKKYLSN